MKYIVRNKISKKPVSKKTGFVEASKLCRRLNDLGGGNKYEYVQAYEVMDEIPDQVRPMTSEEVIAINKLKNVKFNPTSNHMNFTNDMLATAAKEKKLISEKQSAFLWSLVWHYRRQITDRELIELSKTKKVY